MMKSYYEILGIAKDAPQEIIKAVYRTWMHALKAHPDAGGDPERAKEINEAYAVLKDVKKRAKYDKMLADVQVKERRFAPRFRVSGVVACLISKRKDWETADVVDASATGLRLIGNFHIDKGEHVSISFPESSSGSVEAQVVWRYEMKDGRHEFGVAFYKPVHDILKRLVRGL